MEKAFSTKVAVDFPSRGWSMRPLIKPGCRLIVNLFPKSYHRGEIVVFLKRGRMAAHRIIKIKGSHLILKGDNNTTVDGSFEAKQVLGKVEEIIYPKYKINLNSKKLFLANWLLTCYSLANNKLPFLLSLRSLYKIPLFKKLYRFFVSS